MTSAKELALEKAGVLVERTGRKRDRSWGYEGCFDRLRVGTDLDASERRSTPR
jgi:hypothetical protein